MSFHKKALGIFNPAVSIVESGLDFGKDLLSGPEQPAAPDYTGAAEKTAAGNLEMAGYTTGVNRPDQFTPWGSSTWTNEVDEDGNPINFANTVSLSPEQQALFDRQQKTDLLQGDLAYKGLNAAGDIFSTPFDTANYGERQGYSGPQDPIQGYQAPDGNVPVYGGPGGSVPAYDGMDTKLGTYGENRKKVVDSMMSRVNTDIGREKERTSAQLIAQGIPKGSEAYNRQMEQLDRKQTDARQQAEISATQMANLDYGQTLAGRKQQVSELKDKFETGLISRDQYISELKDKYGMDLTSRNQVIDENKDIYNTKRADRNQYRAEAKDDYRFGNETLDNKVRDALMNRQTPLNELAALKSGTAVNNPAFNQFSQQQQILGPDYLGATTAEGNWDLAGWNADTARNNAIIGGLFGVGSAYAGK